MLLYEKFPVTINNSLSRKKEKFVPITPGAVGLYVCGPTVYNHVHLGNCRTFLSFDTIYRYLSYLGYAVRYVRNITDVGHLENDADEGEDKIGKKAKLEQLEPMEIAKRYTDGFHQVLRQFNIRQPSIEPVASGHMIEQIQAVQALLDKGLAYEVNGSVYFDVRKYNEQKPYGILSGRNIEELRASGRELDNQQEKRSNIDFALWKKASPEHIMRWRAPWSDGFPGWHLECSVMSSRYLGKTFDIHGGGMDLKFPHHECELAQGVGLTGKIPANYWIHSNMLTVNGQKMSKSLGNSFLPEQLFSGDHPLLTRGFSPMIVRFFMLQSHYSSTLNFSNEALEAAEKGYRKIQNALADLKKMELPANITAGPLDEKFIELADSCFINMSDDFNTATTLAALFEMNSYINNIKTGNIAPQQIGTAAFAYFRNTYIDMIEEALGLSEETTAHRDHHMLENVIDILIKLRQSARASKNFALSDQIRNELNQAGVLIKDEKDGSTSYTLNS